MNRASHPKRYAVMIPVSEKVMVMLKKLFFLPALIIAQVCFAEIPTQAISKKGEHLMKFHNLMLAAVGHVDGIGLGGNTALPSASWNSAHESRSRADTAPGGGAGRFYCFAAK